MSSAIVTRTAFAAPFLLAAGAVAQFSFDVGPQIPTVGGAVDLVAIDLDGDGTTDVASLEVVSKGGELTGFVNILRNNGDGNLKHTQSINLGRTFVLEAAFRDLEAADLDGDGDIDLGFIGTLSGLGLLFNKGDGTFDSVVHTGEFVDIGPLRAMLEFGDLDNDGDTDIVYGMPGRIGINKGLANFEFRDFTNDNNPINLRLVDINTDGLLDIAFGFRLHINQGDGTFSPKGTFPGAGAPDCGFHDVDNDDDLDAVCLFSVLTSEIRVGLNAGGGIFPKIFFATALGDSGIRFRAADFDGDGNLDIVVVRTFGQSKVCEGTTCISLLAGNGDGTFKGPVQLELPVGDTVDVADMNGDGTIDIIVGDGHMFREGGIRVLLNDPSLFADLDGDGDVDGFDLALLLGAWGSCEIGAPCPADLDGDGQVAGFDLALLLGAWTS